MTAEERRLSLPLPASLVMACPPSFAIYDEHGVKLEVGENFDPRIDPIVYLSPNDAPRLLKWGEEHAAAIVANDSIALWERQFFVQRGLMMEAARLYRHRARFKRLGPLVQILNTLAPFLVIEPSTCAATLSMMPPTYQPEAHAVGTALIAAGLQAMAPTNGNEAGPLILAQLAGLTADVGLVDSHRNLLSFERAMTPPERNILRAHPNSSSRLVARLGVSSEPVQAAIAHHHERIDGSGYPLGLGGNAIPRLAQYVGLADAFVTLTTARPRTDALEHDAALEALSEQGFAEELIAKLERLLAVGSDPRMALVSSSAA